MNDAAEHATPTIGPDELPEKGALIWQKHLGAHPLEFQDSMFKAYDERGLRLIPSGHIDVTDEHLTKDQPSVQRVMGEARNEAILVDLTLPSGSDNVRQRHFAVATALALLLLKAGITVWLLMELTTASASVQVCSLSPAGELVMRQKLLRLM